MLHKNGINMVNLEKRSTTVNIPSNPLTLTGSYVIKSMVTSLNGALGGYNGYNRPAGD